MAKLTIKQAVFDAFDNDILYDFGYPDQLSEDTTWEEFAKTPNYSDAFALYFEARLPAKLRKLLPESDTYYYEFTTWESNDKPHRLDRVGFPNPKGAILTVELGVAPETKDNVACVGEAYKPADLDADYLVYEYGYRVRPILRRLLTDEEFELLEAARVEILAEWEKHGRKEFEARRQEAIEDREADEAYEREQEAARLLNVVPEGLSDGLGMLDKLERLDTKDKDLVRSLIDKLHADG